MDSKSHSFRVLMLPWLAHGHASPFLELAKRLTSTNNNIHVYFCTTPINLSSIKNQLNNKNNTISNRKNSIDLVELHLPSLPDLPPHLHTTKHLPPDLMPTLKEAFDLSEPSFRRILTDLSPDLVIYDFIQPWAPAAARDYGIPAVLFFATGAAATLFFAHHLCSPAEKFPFEPLRFEAEDGDVEYTDQMRKRIANGISDAIRFKECMVRSTGFIAIKSFREIEARYIDNLSAITGKEIIPVGPLVPKDDDFNDDSRKFEDWLGGKERSSVVFVSFGSEYFMSEEEIEEIALGLELSRLNFVWVVRFPEGETELSKARALPSGFMERVGKERGMVVEGWAPQRKILAHPSVGGFLTHCGWSSVMEGMRFGVPMIALPLHLDQPLNAKLVVELGVGVEVRREWMAGFGGFRREAVAKGIKDVMAGKKGGDVRRRAAEMAAIMGLKRNDEIEVLVEKMAELCRTKRK